MQKYFEITVKKEKNKYQITEADENEEEDDFDDFDLGMTEKPMALSKVDSVAY